MFFRKPKVWLPDEYRIEAFKNKLMVEKLNRGLIKGDISLTEATKMQKQIREDYESLCSKMLNDDRVRSQPDFPKWKQQHEKFIEELKTHEKYEKYLEELEKDE